MGGWGGGEEKTRYNRTLCFLSLSLSLLHSHTHTRTHTQAHTRKSLSFSLVKW